jgi:hypothetical protein
VPRACESQSRVVLRVAPARLHVGRLLQRLRLRSHASLCLQKPLRELVESAAERGTGQPSDATRVRRAPASNLRAHCWLWLCSSSVRERGGAGEGTRFVRRPWWLGGVMAGRGDGRGLGDCAGPMRHWRGEPICFARTHDRPA